MFKKMIICIDFDGTIVEHQFPDIGKPLPNAFEVMEKLQKAGHLLILWTCREDDSDDQKYLTSAIEFCKEHGLIFDAVNESVPGHDFRNGLKRKPYANIYIDDRNLGGFPGWDVVNDLIFGDS